MPSDPSLPGLPEGALGLRAAAARFGVPTEWLRKAIAAGDLAAVRKGGQPRGALLVAPADVAAALAAHRAEQTGTEADHPKAGPDAPRPAGRVGTGSPEAADLAVLARKLDAILAECRRATRLLGAQHEMIEGLVRRDAPGGAPVTAEAMARGAADRAATAQGAAARQDRDDASVPDPAAEEGRATLSSPVPSDGPSAVSSPVPSPMPPTSPGTPATVASGIAARFAMLEARIEESVDLIRRIRKP